MPEQNTDLWQHLTLATLVRETEDFRVHEGMLNDSHVRITTLAKQIAEQPQFRAAFRTDIRQLQQLDHTSIASTIDWGEHDGTIFFVTETGTKVPLFHFLETHEFKWEEFVDIAWQLSSALQHVHNAGFTHGHLDQQSILIDDALRISVCDFGLHRWIQQTQQPELSPLFPDAAHEDIVQLGALLTELMSLVSEAAAETIGPEMDDIKDLIRSSRDPQNDVIARDFQGHLGDLLLQDTGDVIDMVDHRAGQQTSRRSIVDELFDDEDQFKSNKLTDLKLPNQPDFIVAGVIVALVSMITALLLLGY